VERITPVLDAALKVSPSLGDDIELARLAALRIGGKQQEANELEATLLAKCVPSRGTRARSPIPAGERRAEENPPLPGGRTMPAIAGGFTPGSTCTAGTP